MKILVRLPNWLGDMVMSTGFLQALSNEYPGAEISVIVKKGLEPLLQFIPGIHNSYVFSRDEWKGLAGIFRFGRMIRRDRRHDLFFCLPDSFSSAWMGWASGSKMRIGFNKEMRSFLLSHSYQRPGSRHRVDEYLSLLEQFLSKKCSIGAIHLQTGETPKPGRVILNFNSEAISRRMPVDKGASLLTALVDSFPAVEWICIGSKKEIEHIESILIAAGRPKNVINQAGQTKNLEELVRLMATGTAMLTTDSGPAHVANALGIPVVVLFGAGNEANTAPYNGQQRIVIRLGELPCEPCVKNTCIYGLPKCLALLDEKRIVNALSAIPAIKTVSL